MGLNERQLDRLAASGGLVDRENQFDRFATFSTIDGKLRTGTYRVKKITQQLTVSVVANGCRVRCAAGLGLSQILLFGYDNFLKLG